MPLAVVEPGGRWAATIKADMARIDAAGAELIGAFITAGDHLSQAKRELDLAGAAWEEWVQEHARVSRPHASRLMQIAGCPGFQDRSGWNSLPPSPQALAKLSHLSAETLGALIASGRINPEMTLEEADKLARDPQGSGTPGRTPGPQGNARAKAKKVGKLLAEPGVAEEVARLGEALPIIEHAAELVEAEGGDQGHDPGTWTLCLIPGEDPDADPDFEIRFHPDSPPDDWTLAYLARFMAQWPVTTRDRLRELEEKERKEEGE